MEDAKLVGNVDGPSEEDVGHDAEWWMAILLVDEGGDEFCERRFERAGALEEVDHKMVRQTIGVF